MQRRAFLGIVAGTTALPLVARAQQRTMPVIGLLDITPPGSNAEPLRAFHQGLKETGYVEGENVGISYRFAENQIDRLTELADDLVRRRVAVITTSGNGVFAAKKATATIPIVFMVADDPVSLGLVASLARPGGNLTGINFLNAELSSKRLELLRELLPSATRIAVLVTPSGISTASTIKSLKAAASATGLDIEVFGVSTSQDIDAAFMTFARQRPDAWREPVRRLSSARGIHGENSERRKATRFASRASHQIRTRHQRASG